MAHRNVLYRVLTVLAPALGAMGFAGGCSHQDADNLVSRQIQADLEAMPAGSEVIAVDSASLSAQIVAIQPAQRTLTIRTRDDQQYTIVASENVLNLDRFRSGDQVSLRVAEVVALEVTPLKGAPTEGPTPRVAISPKDSAPAFLMADTTRTAETITAVNAADGTLTVQHARSAPLKLHVGPKVNLATLKPGDQVTLTSTRMLALDIVPAGR